MKFMLVRSAFVSIAAFFLIVFVSSASATLAQAKKDNKPATNNKKAQTSSKDADKNKPAGKKTAKNDKSAKTPDKNKRDDRNTAKKDDRSLKVDPRTQKAANKKQQDTKADARKNSQNEKSNSKATAKDTRTKPTTAVAKKNEKPARPKAETDRAAEERRQRDLERQQNIAEQRREREQAAREARERALAAVRNLKSDTRSNIARDNTDGEDLAVRNAAIRALGDRAGSVVVMEAKTGKVLTIVNQEWAVRTSIRPCSTIKLVTGVAGVSENVIERQTGTLRESPNGMTLDDALARSNNPYFQRVGSRIGSAKMIEYAKRLGLGEPTGINIEGETAGRLPYGNESKLIYSHGDDFEVSTIQLAVMAATIANGGNRVLPRVPRSQEQNANFQPFYRAKADLPQPNLRRVIPGMMGAAEYGTAHRGLDQNVGAAAKTGTCNGKGTPTGLYTSVAPIEDPKYVVAVITRGPGERGRTAAAVGAQVYAFLSSGIVRTDRNLAQTEFKLPPRNRAVLNDLARTDGEDGDATGAAGRAGNNVIVIPNATRPAQGNPGRLVTRTGDSRPTFPPVVITYDKEKAAGKPDQQQPRP